MRSCGLGACSRVAPASRGLARMLVTAAMALQCAACLVGPDFAEPPAPVADKWLEASNASVDTRNQEYRDWWKVFHDPVLNRLIETAYNQNLTLVSA
jgi:outer membrane protein TolC